jgi:GTP cyclohydrolase I
MTIKREAAEAAVRTLLGYTTDDPDREGLAGTPARVVKAWDEWFSGYREDPKEHLRKVFAEVNGYDEIVCLGPIPFISHCEHHLAAIEGEAWIAYLPAGKVVGISKLARTLDGYARRLQIQERLTAQVADAIEEVLAPRGVAVVIRASHGCMTTRGVRKHGVAMTTSSMRGCFRDEPEARAEVLTLMDRSSR